MSDEAPFAYLHDLLKAIDKIKRPKEGITDTEAEKSRLKPPHGWLYHQIKSPLGRVSLTQDKSRSADTVMLRLAAEGLKRSDVRVHIAPVLDSWMLSYIDEHDRLVALFYVDKLGDVVSLDFLIYKHMRKARPLFNG